ncbi:MAG: GtrA family protein [Eubacterium sp.]|nr:GtrA family protein [Eubacterium sp.]
MTEEVCRETGKYSMKKLFIQILKYSLAGVIAAIVDLAVFSLLSMYHVYYIVCNIASYSCSMLTNYWMSVNFVFDHKKGWSRKKEFTAFVGLSLIGLFINTFSLWFFYDVVFINMAGNGVENKGETGKMICKVGATAILLVYNFISKKIFLEKAETRKRIGHEINGGHND